MVHADLCSSRFGAKWGYSLSSAIKDKKNPPLWLFTPAAKQANGGRTFLASKLRTPPQPQRNVVDVLNIKFLEFEKGVHLPVVPLPQDNYVDGGDGNQRYTQGRE